MSGMKQVMYSYGRLPEDNELVIDFVGIVPMFEIGTLIERRRRIWKVTQIEFNPDVTSAEGLPTMWVYLAEQS
jgi:hypothetical protein